MCVFVYECVCMNVCTCVCMCEPVCAQRDHMKARDSLALELQL